MLASVRQAPNKHKQSSHPRRSFSLRTESTLAHVRFKLGTRIGNLQLAPHMNAQQRRMLEFWIRRLPHEFTIRLPQMKIAVAHVLTAVRKGVVINVEVVPGSRRDREYTHAASFIPQRYVVLGAGLFGRRVELGRILYHELCHFIWPRLGNPKRRRFHALVRRELRDRVRGELGYSSEYRKSALARSSGSGSSHSRSQREYICESFCDTGSYVLLGGERRTRHSEYTLSRSARQRRCRLWSEMVLNHE